MKYMGSKVRIAKHISPIINEAIKNSNGMLFEPFCGGCNVTPYFEGDVIANDVNENLIALFKEAINNFDKTVEALRGMPSLTLCSLPYDEIEIPDNSVIYCDPPYAGTKKYKNGRFDSAAFWRWAEEMPERNTVFVSEYSTMSDLFTSLIN